MKIFLLLRDRIWTELILNSMNFQLLIAELHDSPQKYVIIAASILF
jgi:hypothetical protein